MLLYAGGLNKVFLRRTYFDVSELPVIVLGIESSCDETAAAVCHNGRVLSNIIAGQAIHEQYGGVVPELASRAHLENIVPVVDAALKKAGVSKNELSAIAFTQAPGLIGCLLVGSQFAKSMALSLNIPLLAVHHMQAHVIANLISPPVPAFPFLCLTVSGGHTQLVVCRSPLDLEVIGQTIDDAAGEAFDKSAKLLGLPYPGGPLVDKYAREGNPRRFEFAEPQVPGLDFSFSGVKTSILYFLQAAIKKDPEFVANNRADLCASVQYRIVSILLHKLTLAVAQTGIRRVCIAGGVSANRGLRDAVTDQGAKMGWEVFIPAFEYCTDNAAMIAMTGYYKLMAGELAELSVGARAKSDW